MGKGSVDTSGMNAAMQGLGGMANWQKRQGLYWGDYGLNRTRAYADPVLDEYKRILGFSTAGNITGVSDRNKPEQVGWYQGQPIYSYENQLYSYNYPSGMLPPSGGGVSDQSTWGQGGMDLQTGQPGNKLARAKQPTWQYFGGDPNAVQFNPGYGYESTSGGRYMDPLTSKIFQPMTWATRQAADVAKKGIGEMDILGPVSKALQTGNVDIQAMQSMSQGAMGAVSSMLGSLTGEAGSWQGGASTQAGMFGGASGSYAAQGQIGGQIAQLQMQAQQMQMMGMMSGLRSIGMLGGMMYGGMGGAGMFGAGMAGGAGAASYMPGLGAYQGMQGTSPYGLY